MPESFNRVEVQHPKEATASDRELVEMVVACGEAFQSGIGQDFKDRSERFFRLYRGFEAFKSDWIAARENDRDEVLHESKRRWGANLHIPLSFRTIETMVPRAIAHRPRMLYLPRDEKWEHNVQNVRLLIDAQQENIDIELEYQDVMRSGFLYGLGVSKTFWRREYAHRRRVKPAVFLPGKFRVGRPQRELVFDDPDFEAVDVFDFMWDPFGHSIRSCAWVIHRSWLSVDACMERISSGAWNTETAKALTPDRLRAMADGARWDEVREARMTASGLSNFNLARAEDVLEVWEWHDGDRVLSVVGRQALVQDAENPCFGRIPFQVYRPTKIQGQMVGIGEIEPTEHLQRELDTLRSQRRDAATLALAAGYAYDEAAIDEEDLEFGPNVAIPVRNARVTDAIMPLNRQDVPATAYKDEEAILRDFDSVVGVSDDQPGGPIGTATEAQLVQAALSKRIELKSRRFEVEVVRHSARCFLLLDQRMIVQQRKPIRVPEEGLSFVEAAQAGRWQWFPVGPGELRGEFEVMPEGGSMAAENVPQKRQDGLQIMQLFGNHPAIDSRRPILKALEKFDIKDPEAWLRQADPPVPQAALKALEDMGVNPSYIQHAIRVAQQQDPRLQGPSPDELDGMMGVDREAQAA